MTESTERLRQPGRGLRLRPRAAPWVAWVALALLMAAMGFGPDGGFRFVDSDNLMRLVQVRDWMGGQGWFDLAQHRLGPDGVVMHWSRLVDVPLAGLVLLFGAALEPAAAERAAMIAWPLLLGLPFLAAMERACRALGGALAGWAGLVLALGLALQSLKFVPGAIDHHNLQMVLIATALAGLLARGTGPWALAGTGLASAASLAVGVETAPQVAALSAAVAGLWAAGGRETRRGTLAFAAAFGVALLALFLLATPPENRGWPVCDVLTLGLLVPALVGAGGLGAAALALSHAAPRHRVLALAGVAGMTAVVARTMPGHCLRNPLDTLDPRLRSEWIELVAEARSGLDVLSAGWDQYLGVYVVPLIALAAAAGMALRGVQRGSALSLILLIAVSYAATLYQIRGMSMLGLVSIPPLAAAIGGLYRRYRAEGNAAAGAGALLLLAASLPPAWGAVPVIRGALYEPPPPAATPTETPRAGPVADNCHEPRLYARLAALPPGRVSASSNLGAPILSATPHGVLAAPYHRNQQGMLAQLEIAGAPPGEARQALGRHGVDYVVLCTADAEYDRLERRRPDSLAARLARGAPPDWLEPLSSPGEAIRVYRPVGRAER